MKIPTVQLVLLSLILVSMGGAQIRTRAIEKLPVEKLHEWSSPQFSPDGERIYLTRSDFEGIWEYAPGTRFLRQISGDRGSGYGFAVSADGTRIAYRRSTAEATSRGKSQELVEEDLRYGTLSVLASGADISLPAYARSSLVYSAGKKTIHPAQTSATSVPTLLGIEDTKIAVQMNGGKVFLDPLGHGSYIWPALSPDKTRIVAVEMDRGAFVCDLQGNVLVRLGKRDAPVWTRDGKWIVYMNDIDDGHAILRSDICCVSPDGSQTMQLTETPDILEMNPQCSPTDDTIVCNTPDGDIYLIRYAEGER